MGLNSNSPLGGAFLLSKFLSSLSWLFFLVLSNLLTMMMSLWSLSLQFLVWLLDLSLFLFFLSAKFKYLIYFILFSFLVSVEAVFLLALRVLPIDDM